MIKEALEAAVNFIKSVHSGEWSGGEYSRDGVLTIIEEALAEIEKCEPVAWQGLGICTLEKPTKNSHLFSPLYAHPKSKWVGLSDEEVRTAYRAISEKEWAIGGMEDAEPFARAIEAKLKEKNT
jgi:hypothetical protein